MANMVKYLLCMIYILFSVSGLTLIKIASLEKRRSLFEVPILHFQISSVLLLGIVCYGISFCLYLLVVSSFDLGVIIPIVGGIINICILLVSFFILKEKLSTNMIVGALIIIIGIFIMNYRK